MWTKITFSIARGVGKAGSRGQGIGKPRSTDYIHGTPAAGNFTQRVEWKDCGFPSPKSGRTSPIRQAQGRLSSENPRFQERNPSTGSGQALGYQATGSRLFDIFPGALLFKGAREIVGGHGVQRKVVF